VKSIVGPGGTLLANVLAMASTQESGLSFSGGSQNRR
jgi:hypothetical protein